MNQYIAIRLQYGLQLKFNWLLILVAKVGFQEFVAVKCH